MSEQNQTINFEQKMTELKTIVMQLENGTLSLAEAIKAYEDGASIAKACGEYLQECEERITKISLQSDGTVGEELFLDCDEE